MPETDWLTGLSSRAAFARQVRQADRDRDQFAVTIVGIRRIEEVNRRLGFDVGDELLRTIGRALAGQIGVGTTIARLGGAQFGMMTIGPAAEDMASWCEPVVSAVNGALTEWTFEQIDFSGDCPIQPELVMGAAGGFSGRVWADAALALDQAERDADEFPGQSKLIIHDPADPRLIGLRNREDLNATVERHLDDSAMVVMFQEIEITGPSDVDQRWVRLVAQDPLTKGPLISEDLLPVVGNRLERWLAQEAASLISTHTGQLRVTVPTVWSVDTGPAFVDHLLPTLEKLMAPPSRLIIEVNEGRLAGAGANGSAFVDSVATSGSCLTLANCDGGHRTAKALATPSIRYAKPARSLVTAAAEADRAARRVLDALSQTVIDGGQELIAPSATAQDRCLDRLGMRYAERPTTEHTSTAPAEISGLR